MVRRHLRFLGGSAYRCPAISTTLRSTVMTRAAGSTRPVVRAASSPHRPGVGGRLGHQLVAVAVPAGGQRAAEAGHVVVGGDLGGPDEQPGFPGHAHPRGGQRPPRGLPVHFLEPRAGQVPARDPRSDQRRDHPPDPAALAGRGRGADDLLHVRGPDVLARHRADHRDGEPLTQPPLGMGVLARPLLLGRQPVGRQVIGDQVRAGPLHVRRVRGQPLDHLLQPPRQPVLGPRLALPPTAVLIPDRPPPAPRLPRRVHRHPALQLHHLALTAGGHAAGSARQDRATRLAAGPRPSRLEALAGAGCGISVGILVRAGAICHGTPPLPAFTQVRGLTASAPAIGLEPITCRLTGGL